MAKYKVRIVMDWSGVVTDDADDPDVAGLNAAIESGEWYAEVEELEDEETA